MKKYMRYVDGRKSFCRRWKWAVSAKKCVRKLKFCDKIVILLANKLFEMRNIGMARCELSVVAVVRNFDFETEI